MAKPDSQLNPDLRLNFQVLESAEIFQSSAKYGSIFPDGPYLTKVARSAFKTE
jgi:hypothetical protein